MRIAVLIIALAAGSAAADPPGATPLVEPAAPTPAAPPVESYRAQTLGVDVAAVGMLLLGGSTKSEWLGYASIGTYALGAPLVHLVHDRPARAAGSLALRVGLPVLGAVIGYKTYHSPCPPTSDVCDGELDSANAHAALGLLGGMLATSVLDTVLLARSDEAPAPRSWAPAVSARRNGISLGLTGAF